MQNLIRKTASVMLSFCRHIHYIRIFVRLQQKRIGSETFGLISDTFYLLPVSVQLQ